MHAVRADKNLGREPRRPDAHPFNPEEVVSADAIDRITSFNGGDLRVVSMYLTVPVDLGRRDREIASKADSLLHEIRPLTKDSALDHDVRLSLREDIERIEALVSEEKFKPGTAVIFSCSRGGLFEVIGMPRPLRDRLVTDATPWVRPMLAALDEVHRTCVVVVDREAAHMWELYLGNVRDAGKVKDTALRKPSYAGFGGYDEHRVRNKADELAKRHFRGVAAALDGLFRTDGYDLLVVGGHEHELPPFLDFLPRRLRERVAGTFAIDPETATTRTIREQAEGVLERYEREQERELVAETLERAAAGGHAVVGLERCLWGASVAAIQTLLVQEGATKPGVVCDESGWLALAGDTCPLCGGPTRQTPDVIDELAEAVVEEGGAIRHVDGEPVLRKRLAAAALRFPLPPDPVHDQGAPR
jgi:peptide chain release factor subunit 1